MIGIGRFGQAEGIASPGSGLGKAVAQGDVEGVGIGMWREVHVLPQEDDVGFWGMRRRKASGGGFDLSLTAVGGVAAGADL